ncbi:hypothetical protein MKS83_19510 [Chryseobacterium sp. Y16C]|uniref:hypothetical protein n=1 Tax=Chryseobacterium sp. Y16C TaxID=2920939 RepID=UPI001F0B0863|nr:hypothetical protein [Chryseobacterium sp. Y16C]UMQ41560.1 hypothetical protein MKS83_19510 [Chryseobacterium sp. Y16C]
MKCIICSNDANATGSHIVPASLIQNCVGKHYKEESYSIDAKNVEIDVYFGRDNLKNTSTEIKENHYKEDFILCQDCEDNLAKIEGAFSTNFLQKFREEKYKQNFTVKTNQHGVEILTPLNFDNKKIYFYLYSIIYRFCMDSGKKNGEFFMEKIDLENIRLYLNGYLYGDKLAAEEFLKDFNLVITFDKTNTNGSFISSANQFNNPYLFYFCEPILLLFKGELSAEAKNIFGDYINNITIDQEIKIVTNSEFYDSYRSIMANYLAETFISNAIINLSELNSKSYEENLLEFNTEMKKFDKNDSEQAIKTYELLYEKYNQSKS